MKKTASLLLCLLLLLGLTACGANSSAPVSMKAEAPMAMSAGVSMEAAAPEEAMMNTSMGDNAQSTASALPENRKWIVTVYLDAETEDLDTAISGIDEHIADMGGYVEDQRIYNGSNYANRRYRNASLTVRIPAEQVDDFTARVDGIANVVSKEKNLEDITLTYTATESRIKALQTEEARLLELLAEAENMSDLLEIESRLTDVRYELERYTSQLRLYSNQVDFATIYLNLDEVQEYTPVEEPTLWERISGGFQDSLEGVKEGFVDVFVWLIVASPYLAVFAVLAVISIAVIRKLPKPRLRKKKEPKE